MIQIFCCCARKLVLGAKQMTVTKASKGHKCVSGECEQFNVQEQNWVNKTRKQLRGWDDTYLTQG